MTTISIADLSVAVPSTWRHRRDPAHGVVVAARAPTLPPSGVRPDLVVRTTTVDHDDGAAWRYEALTELAGLLVDFALEDDDVYELDDHEVHYHRFAHRVGTADVLCDQWAWLVGGPTGGLGVTLTCSAARVDYPDWCDVFEAVAETVELGRRAA
ncbi:hypothetical protein [Nocardioides sp.]|uniref:hypothetical protein n=1 Tax=Nocardioides sp. TaxID=35761 RepID=UPI0027214B79|nr:hypothetical protein [Nocardioides sp.]MDO9456661.1 hypothetical protein [Nocardioides sp.]